MGEPIAQYREVRTNGRRRFDLFADRVVIESKSLKADAVVTVSLADLKPEPNILRLRPKEFRLGLSMLLASVAIGLFALATVGPAGVIPGTKIPWMSCVGPLVFVSLVVFARTFRKVEFTQFLARDGKPRMDVGRAGPNRARYREFVELR